MSDTDTAAPTVYRFAILGAGVKLGEETGTDTAAALNAYARRCGFADHAAMSFVINGANEMRAAILPKRTK